MPRKSRPYVDRGKPGTPRLLDGSVPLVPDPPPVPLKTLKTLPVTVTVGINVHAALERWAAWVHDSLASVGWPEKTLLARVIEYGALGAAQGYYGSVMIVGTMVEYDELCGWVEAAIMRLPIDERNIVVRVYLRTEPAEVSANELGITRGTFDSRLSRARRSVKDYLDGRRASLDIARKSATLAPT
jgi:hypothetical protein